jgi:hypothetical protein
LYCYPGFQKITANRGESRVGGGVAAYASSKYNVKTLDTYTSSTTSALWTLIQVPDMIDPLICGVVYHPPGLLKHQRDHTIEYIHDTIRKLTGKHKSARMILYGDFNDLDCSSIAPAFGLAQIVNFPTRNAAFLVKLFTNVLEDVRAGCDAAPPVGNSDHESVEILSAYRKPVMYETILKRVVTPAAKVKISRDLDNQN